MLSRINFIDIVLAQIDTFRDYDTKKFRKSDFVLFIFVPIALALLGLRLVPILGRDAVNVMVTAFSVFAGLLFNLLLLVFDIIRRAKVDRATQIIKWQFLQEIYANISYSILVSILSIIVLLVPLLNIDIPGFSLTGGHSDKVVSAIVYFLTGNFVFTLLMILNRVHVLFSEELK